MGERSVSEYPEQRRSRRAKMAKLLRVRPSEPPEDHFEDLPISVNASREGIYFTTRRNSYYKGMRVFVTFPFTCATIPSIVNMLPRSCALRNCRRASLAWLFTCS